MTFNVVLNLDLSTTAAKWPVIEDCGCAGHLPSVNICKNVKQCESEVTKLAGCQVSGQAYCAAGANVHLFLSFFYKPSGGATGQRRACQAHRALLEICLSLPSEIPNK